MQQYRSQSDEKDLDCFYEKMRNTLIFIQQSIQKNDHGIIISIEAANTVLEIFKDFTDLARSCEKFCNTDRTYDDMCDLEDAFVNLDIDTTFSAMHDFAIILPEEK